MEHIVISGDPVVIPLFREQLPKPLAGKVVDEISLGSDAERDAVLKASLETLGLRGTRAAAMAIANDASIAEPAVEPSMAGEAASADAGTVRLADELVTRAQQTGARICFIEDPALLEPYGGVAATLRYRI